MTPDEDDMLTLTTAAKQTGIPARTLRYAAMRGNLKARLIGKTWVTTPAAIEAWRSDPRYRKNVTKREP